MAAPETKLTLTVPDNIGAPAYANASYIYANVSTEISVAFMRVPLLTDEQVEKVRASGAKSVDGNLVGAITLSREAAKALADALRKVLGA